MSFINNFLARDRKVSYSQCGEDLIAEFVLSSCTARSMYFIDIGAHHPSYLNNTYLFYKKGWRGLNVEPLSSGIALFNKQRPRDINVHAGIGVETTNAAFYVMDPETLSTFDKLAAADCVSQGHSLKREEQVRFLSVKDLIKEYEIPFDVGLMSIDIEGSEYKIIRDFVNAGIRPDILICETAHYSPRLPLAKKNNKLISEIAMLEYFNYADTFMNTIFVRAEMWKGVV